MASSADNRCDTFMKVVIPLYKLRERHQNTANNNMKRQTDLCLNDILYLRHEARVPVFLEVTKFG